MVLALYVIAGLMVAIGLMAVYSGSDIIVMERGWTMVIAGSVVAASGALLGGIATAVARLQALEREFARFSERLGRSQTPSFATALDNAPEVSPGERARGPLSEPRSHRDLDITPEPILSAVPTLEPAAGPLPETPAPFHEAPESVVEPEIFVAEPEPLPAQAETAAEPSPPTIVGTYNSGGNFYVMYSDGSIEAETPAGKFRFNSLDELKEFIATGGDKAKATS